MPAQNELAQQLRGAVGALDAFRASVGDGEAQWDHLVAAILHSAAFAMGEYLGDETRSTDPNEWASVAAYLSPGGVLMRGIELYEELTDQQLRRPWSALDRG